MIGALLRRHALSCGLLLLPAMVWNLALADRLPPAFAPAAFWRDIPAALALAENGLRILVFALPFFMPLGPPATMSRAGIVWYGLGTGLYVASWLALILFPASAWSTSALGFIAPAYTPLPWLFGIALIGRNLYWGRFYRWWMFLVPVLGFLAAHIGHTAWVYVRVHG